MNYADFISVCNLKNLPIQYEYKVDDVDKYYTLWTYDQNIKYKSRINNIDHVTDVSDFETNYKDNANKPMQPRDATNSPIVKQGRLHSTHVYFNLGDDQSLDSGSDTRWSITATSTQTKVRFTPDTSYFLRGGS